MNDRPLGRGRPPWPAKGAEPSMAPAFTPRFEGRAAEMPDNAGTIPDEPADVPAVPELFGPLGRARPRSMRTKRVPSPCREVTPGWSHPQGLLASSRAVEAHAASSTTVRLQREQAQQSIGQGALARAAQVVAAAARTRAARRRGHEAPFARYRHLTRVIARPPRLSHRFKSGRHFATLPVNFASRHSIGEGALRHE